MPKKRGKSKGRKVARRFTPRPPAESRAAEAITVVWTVSLTTVLACNLVAVAAHLYVRAYPPAERMLLLEGLMLFGGCVLGVICLALLPIVYRVRRLPPPPGIVFFGVLISLAPILAVMGQFLLR